MRRISKAMKRASCSMRLRRSFSPSQTRQRTGVLAIPEVNQLIAEVLEPPPSIEVPPEAAALRESWSEVGGGSSSVEAVAAAEAGEPPEEAAADPVERWRPLVERFFAEERVAEALSIIVCESNGDPSITNPRAAPPACSSSSAAHGSMPRSRPDSAVPQRLIPKRTLLLRRGSSTTRWTPTDRRGCIGRADREACQINARALVR